ncbi:hypothetical protein ACFU98_37525 [Streptomyces sp. NPDC057575]|uniref:hypothetical protein n=1 Tax=unclassified Streptomyces TaxID=2593676 RepID=UPI00368362E3
MLKRTMVTLATAVLGLSALAAAPAQAAPVAQAGPPTGCVTSIEWFHDGPNFPYYGVGKNFHYYGVGNVRCDTGTYQAKVVCLDVQSGVGYVAYSSDTVEAPMVAAAVCNYGHVAKSVHVVPV